jgi:hypothetical protein
MAEPEVVFEARCLVRAARSATLATATEGQPFASLVTPATTPEGDVLLLLSDLSEHTRHLRADPRCALLVAGAPAEQNPQTAPRLTLTGLASIESDAALKRRFLAVHPYAAVYADFGDFALWRIRPGGGLFVGGFARAVRLRQADLRTEAPAIAAAEVDIVTHCNDDHADAMELLGSGPGWRMVAADADGVDLADGTRSRRVAFHAPAADPSGVRLALIALLRARRQSG